VQHYRHFDPTIIEVLLCDADGNLFPSEDPAFDASVGVTNRFLERFGLRGDRTAAELRKTSTGKNFRTTAVDLAAAGGVPLEPVLAARYADATVASQHQVDIGDALTCQELEQWVHEERSVVIAHLAVVLGPDPDVGDPLARLSRRYRLSAVSSSASARLEACFAVTGLDLLLPAHVRFSAEDSLPVPTGKPDPAVYLLAGEVMGVHGGHGLAIEDSVPGVLSAVGAGFVVVGNVMFVSREERVRRAQELRDAGVSAVVETWRELEDFLESSTAAGMVSKVAARCACNTGRSIS
jgi:beta-phosphoglucomutase-like phosphatase (HAD superfamily)